MKFRKEYIILICIILLIVFRLKDSRISLNSNDIIYPERSITFGDTISIGDCFYYFDSSYYYPVVFIGTIDYYDDVYGAAPLSVRFKDKPSINNFRNGSLIHEKFSSGIIQNGAEGLNVGTFDTSDINIFLESFKYVGHLSIDRKLIKTQTHGTLILEDSVWTSYFTTLNSSPDFLIRTYVPITKYIKEYAP